MDPIVFDQIEFNPDTDRFLKKMRIKPDSRQKELVFSLLDEGRQIGRPRAIYSIAGIDQHLEDGVVLNGIRMNSKVMSINLTEVHRVFPYLASSGREVPKATNVRPIAVSLTPKCRAIMTELSTRRSAPSGRPIRPSSR